MQILLSVLLQCSKITFKLELKNSYSSFLDLSWKIPQVLQLELIPCQNLGLGVRLVFFFNFFFVQLFSKRIILVLLKEKRL